METHTHTAKVREFLSSPHIITLFMTNETPIPLSKCWQVSPPLLSISSCLLHYWELQCDLRRRYLHIPALLNVLFFILWYQSFPSILELFFLGSLCGLFYESCGSFRASHSISSFYRPTQTWCKDRNWFLNCKFIHDYILFQSSTSQTSEEKQYVVSLPLSQILSITIDSDNEEI